VKNTHNYLTSGLQFISKGLQLPQVLSVQSSDMAATISLKKSPKKLLKAKSKVLAPKTLPTKAIDSKATQRNDFIFFIIYKSQ